MLIFWIFIFFVTFVWLFFILKKLNSDNFLNLSSNIFVLNKLTFIFLLFFTIIWIVIIIKNWYYNDDISIKENINMLKSYY